MTREAVIAVNRFGLGPRPGELASAARDPRGWAVAQLAGPSQAPGNAAGAERITLFINTRNERQDIRAAQNPDAPRRPGAQPVPNQPAMRPEQFPAETRLRALYQDDMAARTRNLITTTAPFRERLVMFWSNHFTVSVLRPPVLATALAFENEAIRPHVTGKFADMLLAVARHPAMIFYLDNIQSVGPNSLGGRTRGAGLNENLAREILELHTLGVEGGYTQNDVREFAKIITGWSIARPVDPNPGRFMFRPRIHEPGDKTLLGQRYGEGEREGVRAMNAIARHPATARHVATKLARHFIADDPPPAAIGRLARVFTETDGDLGALARAVVTSPEVWADTAPKIKTAAEFVVGALRACDLNGADGRGIVGAQALLGQPPFAASSPAGWPDRAAQWIGAESVMRRAEWALTLGQRLGRGPDPIQLFETTIAPVAGRDTRMMIEGAPSRPEAIALIIASAEFQRR